MSGVGVGGSGGGSATPTTTKGDLIARNATTDVRVPVGADTFVLTADSGSAAGVAWAAAPGAGSGAPTDATYVTLTTNATLSNERTLVDDGTTVQRADGGAGSNVTLSVRDNGINFAKMQDIATDTLIGRASALSGDPEAIACTAAGRALIAGADASAQRTTLGLGTLATQSGTFSGTHSGTSSGTNTGDQTNITGNAATVTTNANLTGPITSVGNATTIADAELAAIAGLTSAADRLPYFTGAGAAALATYTAFARTLDDDADAATARATLGALGGALGGTDNQLLRSDGTGGVTAQGTTITVDDANGIAGHTEVQNVQTGTTYTLTAGDCGKVVIFTSATAVTVTIPQTLTVGWHCRWEQQGAGKVSFNGTAVTAATLRNRQTQVASAGQYAVGGLACYTTGTPAVVTLFGDTGA